MPIAYILNGLWEWIAAKGITLALILVVALMVPRLGRFVIREINSRIENSQEQQEGKTSLALTTAAVYIGQLAAYFLLMVGFLATLGFSLAGAAIPATVVSAALGLGAQSIIADFLAGFFILTEKQYGINDWVRFESGGVQVEGTVISITLRATRIRTLAQETVTIPNSTPKICVNSSQYWSGAVVVMPVPLRSAQSTDETVERVTAAAERALARPEIAADVQGELVVQPAVAVTPPSTVGTPWTMSVRLMVTSAAGAQWAVERAVRTAIVDEFWDEYGSAPSMTGGLVDHATARAAGSAQLSGPAQARSAGRIAETAPDLPVDPAAVTSAFPGARVERDAGGRDAASPSDPQTRPLPNSPAAGPDPGGRDDACPTTDAGAAAQAPRVPGEADPAAQAGPDEQDDERPSGWLSLGGRVRPSTTALGAALVVLVFLWASTIQTDEDWSGRDGWLAPRGADPAATAPAEPAAPADPEGTQATPPAPAAPETTTGVAPSERADSGGETTGAPGDRGEQTTGRAGRQPAAPESAEPTAPETAPATTARRGGEQPGDSGDGPGAEARGHAAETATRAAA